MNRYVYRRQSRDDWKGEKFGKMVSYTVLVLENEETQENERVIATCTLENDAKLITEALNRA